MSKHCCWREKKPVVLQDLQNDTGDPVHQSLSSQNCDADTHVVMTEKKITHINPYPANVGNMVSS